MKKIQQYLQIYQDMSVLVVLLLFLVAGIIFGIIPGGQRTFVLWDEVQKTAATVETLRAKSTVLEGLSETDLADKLKTVVSAVPADKSLPTVFQMMETLSSESNITILSMAINSSGPLATAAARQQTTEEVKLGSSALPFTFSGVAQLDSLDLFLSRLNKVRRLLRLKNFNLSIASTNSASLQLSLDAYYSSLPQYPLQLDQQLPELTAEDNNTLATLTSYSWISQPSVLTTFGTGGKVNPFSH